MKIQMIRSEAEEWQKLLENNSLEEVAIEKGLHLYYRKDFDKLLGMYAVILKRRCIFLNENMSAVEKKMVLAHEIGHDVLHRNLAKQRQFQEFNLLSTTSIIEYEANVFASFLLIGDEDLYQALEEVNLISHLASIFGVDEQLILIRLKETPELSIDNDKLAIPNGEFLKYL